MTRALSLAAALALMVGALILIGRSFTATEVETSAAPEELPRYAVTNASWLRLNGQGRPEFHARASSIEYFGDESARLGALEVSALGGWSSPWSLTAPHGSARPGERRLLLEGGVTGQGTYAEGTPLAFRSDRLWVDLLRREFYTESRVAVESPLWRATARGFEADFNGESMQLLDDVEMEYQYESG